MPFDACIDKFRYLKNPKLFSIRVKELPEPIVLRRKADGFLLSFKNIFFRNRSLIKARLLKKKNEKKKTKIKTNKKQTNKQTNKKNKQTKQNKKK